MFVRRLIAGLLVASLFALPVLASDLESVSNEESSMDDVQASEADNSDSEVIDLAALEEGQETINNNLTFLVACVMSCAGCVVGYWTGKDLLSIW